MDERSQGDRFSVLYFAKALKTIQEKMISVGRMVDPYVKDQHLLFFQINILV